MGALNQVTLIGNVGKDPEIKQLTNGRVAKLTLATTDSWKDKATGTRKEVTDWHNVVIYGEGLVGVVDEYVHKGSQLCIQGKLKTRSWEKDGVKHYITEVVVQGFDGKLIMLGKAGAPRGTDTTAVTKATTDRPSLAEELDDEIPF